MQTDRELLELAAKAAGIKVFQRGDGYWTIKVHERGMRGWNPWIDDGDALRLAVKLGIKITPYPIYTDEQFGVIASCMREVSDALIGPEVVEEYGSDPNAATRRAIVLVAAEIGKAMP